MGYLFLLYKSAGYDIEKKKIILPLPIKTLGVYDIDLKFMESISAKSVAFISSALWNSAAEFFCFKSLSFEAVAISASPFYSPLNLGRLS